MSRAIGIGAAQFIGARVAGRDGTPSVTYIPAHNKNGKPINQRCIIPVYINSNRGTNRDGTPGRSDRFRLVAWGKLADICARSLPKGKALDCVCSPHSYEGRIYDAQGNMRVDNTGQPITVERIGFTIERIVFGEESQKEIDAEIQNGRRPFNWNVPNHPDYQSWLSICQQRQALQYTGGEIFGFARVIIPSGPGITLMTNQPAGVTPMAGQPAGVTSPIIDPNQLAQAVAQVLRTPAPVQAPVQYNQGQVPIIPPTQTQTTPPAQTQGVF